MKYHRRFSFVILLSLAIVNSAIAFEIVIDYTYDTQSFFDTQHKRDALQAAADRYSRVIDSPLLAVSPTDSSPGWRIGFSHPGTGGSIQLSTAINLAADPITTTAADVYGFAGLEQGSWILFAGGRSLTSAGIGGTGTGINFTTTFDDLDGPMHRGVISNTTDNSVNDLPAWGGSVTFNSDRPWHFDLASVAPFSDLDFYTIALHEIGHALGLGTSWNQWQGHVTGASFLGANALAAYNQDHGTTLTQLSLESATDPHWRDETHDSFIFPFGQPVEVGTVGAGQLQDLLMEPTANFSSTVSRFELTNVDVAGLRDVGWSIITGPDLDRNGDGRVDGVDVDLACTGGAELSDYFASLGSLPGDLNLDGQVQFADFLAMSGNWGLAGTYTQGDINCDGHVQFGDFLILSTNFGKSASVARTVPEPTGPWLVLAAMLVGACRWRR